MCLSVDNNIGAEGAIALADALKVNQKLQILNLGIFAMFLCLNIYLSLTIARIPRYMPLWPI